MQNLIDELISRRSYTATIHQCQKHACAVFKHGNPF